MALVQLNMDISLASGQDRIIQLKKHQLSYVPETIVNHIETSPTYKDKIEFLERVDEGDVHIPVSPDKSYCTVCPRKISCLMVKQHMHETVKSYRDVYTNEFILDGRFFKITVSDFGKIYFNGKVITKAQLADFFFTCPKISINENLIRDVLVFINKINL